MKMTPRKDKKYYYDWSDKVVYRILKNKTYMGKIVKRKSTKKSHLQKKREFIPIRDRETIDNCHPAIISEKLFNEANNKLLKLKRKEKNDYCGLFSGLVICGECGRVMTACRRNDRKNIQYYFSCTKVVERKHCPNRTIADSKLRSIVSVILKEIIDDIELHNTNIRNLYLKKTKGEITLEQFLEGKKNETLLKEASEKLLKETLESKNENIRKSDIVEKYKHFLNGDEFMNIALRDLVDKIIIYKDNTVKISFKFGLGKPKKIKLF